MENQEIENQVVQEPVVQMQVEKEMEAVVPGSSKKTGIIVGCVIGIVVLLVGVFGAYIYFNNPKNLMTTSVNRLYSKVDNAIDDLTKGSKFEVDTSKDPLNISGSATLRTNIDDLVSLNDHKLNFDIGVDNKNKNAALGLELSDKSKKIINGNAYAVGDDLYLSIKDIYSNLLYIGDGMDWTDLMLEVESASSINVDDAKYILKAVKDSFLNTIDSKHFSQEKDTIKFNGKDLKVNKITYSLNEEEMQNTFNQMIDELTENDTFLSKLSEMLNIEKSEIKSTLKELKNEDLDLELDITLYAVGFLNQVIGFELEFNDEVTMTSITKNNYTEIQMEAYGSVAKVTIDQDGKAYDIDVFFDNEKIATAKIVELSDEKLDMTVTIPSEEISVTVLITNKTEKTKISGEYYLKLALSDEYVELSGEYSIEIKEVQIPNTSNAVNFSDLSEEDLLNIEAKLLEALEGTILGDLLSLYPTDLIDEPDYSIYEDENCWNAYLENTDSILTYSDYYDMNCR